MDEVRVPREPTREMCMAADAAMMTPQTPYGGYIRGRTARCVWAAMIAAAPQPAAQPEPQRAPLSKAQIDFILADAFLAANRSIYSTRVYDFVRAVEEAHGITDVRQQPAPQPEPDMDIDEVARPDPPPVTGRGVARLVAAAQPEPAALKAEVEQLRALLRRALNALEWEVRSESSRYVTATEETIDTLRAALAKEGQ